MTTVADETSARAVGTWRLFTGLVVRGTPSALTPNVPVSTCYWLAFTAKPACLHHLPPPAQAHLNRHLTVVGSTMCLQAKGVNSDTLAAHGDTACRTHAHRCLLCQKKWQAA